MIKNLFLNNKSDSVVHKIFWDSFFVMLIPALISAMSKIIDSLMVNHLLSTEMFAAQSLASPFFTFVAITSGLLATGTQIVVSKHIVKGNFEDADHVFTLSVIVGLIISSVVTAVCIVFNHKLPGILGAGADDIEIYKAAESYLLGLSTASIPLTLNAILRVAIQINGDRARAKYTTFAIMGTNCILNASMVLLFDMGIFGIGLATSISQWAAFVIFLLHFTKPKIMCRFRFRGVRLNMLDDFLVPGLPKVTLSVCNLLRPVLVNRWILILSTSAALSAMGICNTIMNLFMIPSAAIASTVMLTAGAFYGEQDKTSLQQLVCMSATYSVRITLIMSAIVVIFAPYLVSLYVENGTEIHEMTCFCLRWTAVMMLFFVVNEYYTTFMLATGRYRNVHIFTICEKFIYIVVAAYILGMQFGVKGVFLSFGIAEICFTVHILIMLWIKHRKFPTKLDQFMMLPEELDIDSEKMIEFSIDSLEDVIGVSGIVQNFCRERGIDSRRSFYAALCTEEMAANIVRHGFVEGEEQNLTIRILISNDNLIMRFRDPCNLFDLREHYEAADKKDVTKNIGIRLVMKMAKEVMYMNTLNINTTIIKL